MNADEVLRTLGDFGKASDRQGRGVGSENHRGLENFLGLLSCHPLDFTVLEHGFDHQISAFEQSIVRRCCDER